MSKLFLRFKTYLYQPDLMREIELILKRYHISLKRVVCASYVEGLFSLRIVKYFL